MRGRGVQEEVRDRAERVKHEAGEATRGKLINRRVTRSDLFSS